MLINQTNFNNLPNQVVMHLFQFLPDQGFEMVNVEQRCNKIAYLILDRRVNNCDSGLVDFLKRKYFGRAYSLNKNERRTSDCFISHSNLEAIIDLVSKIAANAYKNENDLWPFKKLLKPISLNFQNEESLELFYKCYFLNWNLPGNTKHHFDMKKILRIQRRCRLNLISKILKKENDLNKIFIKLNEVIEVLSKGVDKNFAIFTVAFELGWFSNYTEELSVSSTDLDTLVLKYADLIGLPLQSLAYIAHVVTLKERGKLEEARDFFNLKLVNSGITFEQADPFIFECTLDELQLLS